MGPVPVIVYAIRQRIWISTIQLRVVNENYLKKKKLCLSSCDHSAETGEPTRMSVLWRDWSSVGPDAN